MFCLQTASKYPCKLKDCHILLIHQIRTGIFIILSIFVAVIIQAL